MKKSMQFKYLQVSYSTLAKPVEKPNTNLNNKVLFITLDRVEKLNALHPGMIHSLLQAFNLAHSDPNIYAVVLSGKGKAFCSGADLRYLKDKNSFSKRDLDQLFTLLDKIDTSPVPVIAKVHGLIMGGGIGLISTCDIVCAEHTAKFQFSETRVALVPSIISPFIIKKISLTWVKFFMLSGLVFGTKEAKLAGLVHFVGTARQCGTYLESLLRHLSSLDSVAVRKTKHILKEVNISSLKKCRAKLVQAIHVARSSLSAKSRIKKILK